MIKDEEGERGPTGNHGVLRTSMERSALDELSFCFYDFINFEKVRSSQLAVILYG